ncbi:MAG: TetR/AcrR family transcriptional regulator [Spirochaetales bacterium]|nr:TetR/AcrR family transcriptional regulator [Spirochaetales bacterium]
MSAKEKLLYAASRLFEEKGYSGTTTAAVAAMAGVAEVTLFRHFKNKETLFRETVKQIQGSVILEISDREGDPDLRDGLCHFAKTLCRYFMEQNRTIRMMLFESIRNPELKDLLKEGPMRSVTRLEFFFSYHISQGRLPSVDPRIYADSLISLVFGYTIGLVSLKEKQDINSELEYLEDIITTAFLPELKH